MLRVMLRVMLVRTAEQPDLPALLEVQQSGAVQALAHIFPQDAHPFPRDKILARWVEEIADPEVMVLVVEDDQDRIVGFTAIRGEELLHFGTAVDTWGTGLAAAVHNDLLQRFVAAGVTRARLRVFEDNHRARRFYEKLGWRRTERRTRSSFPPYPVLVDYQRDLSPT